MYVMHCVVKSLTQAARINPVEDGDASPNEDPRESICCVLVFLLLAVSGKREPPWALQGIQVGNFNKVLVSVRPVHVYGDMGWT